MPADFTLLIFTGYDGLTSSCDAHRGKRAWLIDRFEATIGDRVVKTKTKRKTEAIAEFSAGTQQGHTAIIAKQVDSSTDVVTIGRLWTFFLALSTASPGDLRFPHASAL